jgi:hypothetical protein
VTKYNVYKQGRELGVVAHACNPSTPQEKQKDLEFEASLGYRVSSRSAWDNIVRPYLKRKEGREGGGGKKGRKERKI